MFTRFIKYLKNILFIIIIIIKVMYSSPYFKNDPNIATSGTTAVLKLRARNACVTTTATSDVRPPKEDSIL